MHYNLIADIESLATDTLILAVKSTGQPIIPGAIAKKIQDPIKKAIKNNGFTGKKDSSIALCIHEKTLTLKVILMGLGTKDGTLESITQYKALVSQSIKIAKQAECKSIVSALPSVTVKDCKNTELYFHATTAAESELYEFTELKSSKSSLSLKKITWINTNKKDTKKIEHVIKVAKAISQGSSTARNLGNLSGNICTPTYMAQISQKLSKRYPSISCKIINTPELKKMKMGAFLSVAKGSEQPPKLIIIHYKGNSSKKKKNPIVLVGKGITFDTGGISLKPSEAMVGMKYDMCGAASVVGTLEALAELKAEHPVIGVLACAENMPSHNASKPDDVVTSMSGQTIEIANTDAEGRLVLCDSLTYCERFKPSCVIDIATLTGACVIALGSIPSGLYSNDQTLANNLLKAGQQTHDRAWQMPLWEDYQAQLNSPVADVCNIGGREAGSVTAACFLARFTKKYKWAHLDVAGTAFRTGKNAAASGRPVPLLTQFILNQ